MGPAHPQDSVARADAYVTLAPAKARIRRNATRKELKVEEDALVYDVEEAARVVAERTGLDLEKIENILEAEFLFQAAFGAFEIPDDEEGEEFQEEVRQLREAHSDLIPPIDANLDEVEDLDDRLVTFVTRLTGEDPASIEDVLDEHILYLEEKGFIEPEEDN